MAEQFDSLVTITKAGTSDITVRLDANGGNVTLGGNATDGDITLKDNAGNTRISLDAQGQTLTIRRANGTIVVRLGSGGNLTLGGNGQDGDLLINAASGNRTIHLSGDGAIARFGGKGANGRAIFFRAEEANPAADSKGTLYVNGDLGNIRLGGNGTNGRMAFFRSNVTGNDLYDYNGKATIQLQGSTGNLTLGGNGQDGDLLMKRANGSRVVHLDGENANLWMGGKGVDGDIVLFPSSATNLNDTNQSSIHLDGNAGDIILRNADCAEDFDVSPGEEAEPGTVMVINAEGKLEPGAMAYDKRVAGVVSGAGEFKPGLVLDRQSELKNRRPIALLGKVFCRVDADYAPIEMGDLLTTSPTKGHAMRALDPLKAFGTVIGKALQPLESGRSLIPILIALQ